METASNSNCSFSNQDDDIEYEVEEITGKKISKKGVFYKVKWKGYSASESTWEPKENLANAEELIEEFEKNYNSPQTPEKKKKLCPRSKKPASTSMLNRVRGRTPISDDEDDIKFISKEKVSKKIKSIDVNLDKKEKKKVVIKIDAVKFIGDELFAYVVLQEGKEKKEKMISTKELVELDAPKLVKYYESKITLKKN